MSALDIPTAEVFEPLLKPSRYKGAHGGRGSGKSHFFGGLVVEEHATMQGHRTVCIREVQKSIKLSSKQLIVDKINQFNLNHLFEVQDQVIKTPKDGLIVFQGLQNHTAESIKSLEGFDRVWVEEAQSISKYSWDMLRPTFRKPGSEIWASWNPLLEEDAIDKFFRGPGSDRSDMVTVQANWSDNPWFNQGTLPDERIEDLRSRPDDYDWIWEGSYRTVSEAAIFRGKFEITEFDTPDDTIFFHGADWGYANDPTTLIRMFIVDKCLYIDQECYSTGIELDDLPRFFDGIPTARKWPIRADAAAPQIISYVKRNGFNISAAKKWPKSVEEGIAYLRGFHKIYIHRRCVNTAKEFRSYSWKTDRHSGVLVPVPEDANNHAIDACVARGELITTLRGHVPVEDVTEDDFVLTRFGYKKVNKSWVSGQDREVWEVKTNKSSVWLTPNHLVFVEKKGFVRVDALEYGDVVLIEREPHWVSLKRKFLSIKGKLTGAIRKVPTIAMRLISR